MPANPVTPLPSLVAHADWSLDPRKRWLVCATLQAPEQTSGRYRAAAPEPVGPPADLLDRLQQRARRGRTVTGPLLVGFDFPIGLPRAYAERAGIADFRRLLPRLGRGEWRSFFTVAERPGEIGLQRPFYPAKAARRGTAARVHLLEGLGLARYAELLRACDLGDGRRPPACALFWTLGPQQVGKAAIVGWRELLIPALRSGRSLGLWPFDGDLAALLASREVVLAETYPAEIYRQLGLRLGRGGKRAQAARAALAQPLLQQARALGVSLAPALRAAILEGFGAAADGEDRFDATLGLLGMIKVVRGGRRAAPPLDPATRRIEGWILGQAPPAERSLGQAPR